MEWQPIETAPANDLKHILLFGDGSGFAECVFVGYWDDDAGKWFPFDGNGFVKPTHWMPLPEAPNASFSRGPSGPSAGSDSCAQ